MSGKRKEMQIGKRRQKETFFLKRMCELGGRRRREEEGGGGRRRE